MSTKIFNGMKFKSRDFKEVLDQLKGLKPKAIEMIDIDDDSLEYLISKDNLIDRDAFDIWNHLKSSEHFIGSFHFKVVLFPTKEGDIYGYHMCGDHKYVELLDGIYDEFNYWNHTDCPDDLDYADWEWQGMKWEELIGDSYYISDAGFNFNIVGINDLNAALIRKQIAGVVEIMKRDQKIDDVLNK